MPTDADRQEAQKDLKESLKYREKKTIGFVHYECAEIGKERDVHAIAVKIPSAVRPSLFSAAQGEAKSLKRFAEYIAEYDKFLWCVWGMRNEEYGFPHLNARLRELTTGKVNISIPSKILDLSKIYWQLYGDIDTNSEFRLPYLCGVNGIRTQGILDFQAIQVAVKKGRWSAVEASVFRKVEMIYALWDRLVADGPIPPDSFRWQGEEYSGLPVTSWRLLDIIWKTRRRCYKIDNLCKPVWKDNINPFPDSEQIKGVCKATNKFFGKHPISLRVAKKGDFITLVNTF